MAKVNGAQTVDSVLGRRIVVSSAVGQTNVDELKWLTDTVLGYAAAWKNVGWAYIADCSKMKPISPAESVVLVEMTKKFVAAGCKAFAFAEGNSIMLKAQAHGNTQQAGNGLVEGHFATVDQAKDWLKKTVMI